MLSLFQLLLRRVHPANDAAFRTQLFYAVRNFFQLDPKLVSPLIEVDLAALVAEGLVLPGEVEDLQAFAG